MHPFGAQQVADFGDIGVNPFDIQEALATVDGAVTDLRKDGSTVLTLGGDHTIALPILRSLARDHGPIAVLHFDAHLDTWDTYFGAPFTHGTPFRRASEEGLIDLERSQHIGIRGPLYSKKDLEDDAVLGFQVIRSDDYEVDGVASIVERMRRRLDGGPVYVSVDIDVLDPAHAPGTGTPEAGGMTSRELLNTLRGLVGLNVVGADIVEVAPAYDHAEITGIAAAHVAYELLSVLAINASFGSRTGRPRRGTPAGGVCDEVTPPAPVNRASVNRGNPVGYSNGAKSAFHTRRHAVLVRRDVRLARVAALPLSPFRQTARVMVQDASPRDGLTVLD